MAVSYTHLDVYKRQVSARVQGLLHGEALILAVILQCLLPSGDTVSQLLVAGVGLAKVVAEDGAGLDLVGQEPVSYTHLGRLGTGSGSLPVQGLPWSEPRPLARRYRCCSGHAVADSAVQPLIWRLANVGRARRTGPGTPVPIRGAGPVSYTHLDVYKRQRIDIITIFAVLLAALIAYFFVGRWYFQDKAAPGVHLGNVSVMGQTREELANTVKQQLNNTTVTFTAEGNSVKASLKDLSLIHI